MKQSDQNARAESAHEGVNYLSKYVTQVQQQRPESLTVTLTSDTGGCTLYLHTFMYFVFTRMPGESYRGRLMSLLLYLCYVSRALINSLVC